MIKMFCPRKLGHLSWLPFQLSRLGMWHRNSRATKPECPGPWGPSGMVEVALPKQLLLEAQLTLGCSAWQSFAETVSQCESQTSVTRSFGSSHRHINEDCLPAYQLHMLHFSVLFLQNGMSARLRCLYPGCLARLTCVSMGHEKCAG